MMRKEILADEGPVRTNTFDNNNNNNYIKLINTIINNTINTFNYLWFLDMSHYHINKI